MSETSQGSQGDIDQAVEDKKREMHADNLAYLAGLEDPDVLRAMIDRMAAETEMEDKSRHKAANLIRDHKQEEQAQRYSRHPWGLSYLEEDHDPHSVYERVARERAAEEKPQESEELVARREEELEREMAEARQLTLAIGRLTAEKLDGQVAPDIVVQTEHVREVKQFSAEGLRLEGKLRSQVPHSRFIDTARGWRLPISGQIDRHATVVLCTDGRILTAYGSLKENQGGPDRLVIKPNRARQPGKSSATYSRFIDQNLESDIGMTNLPIDTPVAKAHVVFDRERAMQEAVVSLLVDNGIDLEDGQPTQAA